MTLQHGSTSKVSETQSCPTLKDVYLFLAHIESAIICVGRISLHFCSSLLSFKVLAGDTALNWKECSSQDRTPGNFDPFQNKSAKVSRELYQ